MLAIVMRELGPSGVLNAEQISDPTPGPDEVLIEVAYASVTFVETQVRAGTGPFGHPSLPRVPGNGVGGRITAIGEEVDPGLLGATVVSTTGGVGGYAERAVAKANAVVPIPPKVDVRDAVAVMADGRTALLLTDEASIRPGETVLVEAAAGGVGTLLVQLALRAGARVIGAAGSAGKRDLITSLGADFADYSQTGWADALGEVDVLFDGVGGVVGAAAAGAVRDGGRISVYGMASGSEADRGPARLDARSIRLLGLSSAPSAAANSELIRRALQLVADGDLRPVIGQTFPLTDAAGAHAAIESRSTRGKTLLVTNAGV